MILRECVFCVLAAAGFVNFVQAQAVRGCPDGQAVNSLNPNGTPVQCVPVPPPVNIAPLEAAILQESVERKAADDDLRASFNEASIVGRYAFTGTQACLNASRGFNADFTPIMPPAAAAGQPAPVSIVSQTAASVSGFRTFNTDGTGTSDFVVNTLNYSPIVYTNFNGFVQANVSGNGLPTASSTTQSGTFAWRIENGTLIIDDSASGGTGGVITAGGGGRVGWTVSARGVPNAVGVLGKDLRIITLTQAGPGVEVGVQTSPPDQPAQVIETPRICVRERVLRKL